METLNKEVMKNTQLMRLNKVLHEGVVKTVDCISPGYVSFIEDAEPCSEFGKWVGLDEVELIPLDAKWLDIMGFKIYSKHSYHTYLTKKKFYVSMWMEDEPDAGFEKKGMVYWGDDFTEIPYVHNLQNLYMALHGKRL